MGEAEEVASEQDPPTTPLGLLDAMKALLKVRSQKKEKRRRV